MFVEKTRPRLIYLDGIRGLAAFYVVLYHAWILLAWDNTAFTDRMLSRPLKVLSRCVAKGHFAVGLFIVLSGYCLMLPVARRADGQMAGGTWKYFKRRLIRILPPYYAAAAISLALIAYVPVLGGAARTTFTPGVILSHLGMVHNLRLSWKMEIDQPMWSVATEFDIYILFPLILLPLWRSAGIVAALAGAILLGIGTHWLWHGWSDYLLPWYLTIFTFGMAAAVINYSAGASRLRRWPWGTTALIASAIALIVLGFCTEWAADHLYLADPIIGAAAAALLIYWGSEANRRQRPWSIRFLESPPVVWLGVISYSLYLMHFPILSILRGELSKHQLSVSLEVTIMLIGGTLLSLLLSWVFHLIFERPFMRSHPQAESKAAVAAVIEPAP